MNKLQYLDENYEVLERPLWWHKQGLSQTASGYGKKLTSSRMIKLDNGLVRRIYVTRYSNAGTAWVILVGQQLIIR